jgi:hypothetical protein
MGRSMVIFKYELSAINVVYTCEDMKVLQFLINLCAIIGGFITVSSILDSVLRNILPEEYNENKKGSKTIQSQE